MLVLTTCRRTMSRSSSQLIPGSASYIRPLNRCELGKPDTHRPSHCLQCLVGMFYWLYASSTATASIVDTSRTLRLL